MVPIRASRTRSRLKPWIWPPPRCPGRRGLVFADAVFTKTRSPGPDRIRRPPFPHIRGDLKRLGWRQGNSRPRRGYGHGPRAGLHWRGRSTRGCPHEQDRQVRVGCGQPANDALARSDIPRSQDHLGVDWRGLLIAEFEMEVADHVQSHRVPSPGSMPGGIGTLAEQGWPWAVPQIAQSRSSERVPAKP
jgi:hypothetical protein